MIFESLAAKTRSLTGRAAIVSNAMIVAGFLSLVKIAGAAKILLMANRFGAGDDLDAFLVAFSLPAFLSDVIVGSLPPALVPGLIGVRESHGRPAMYRLHGSITLLVFALLALGAAVLVLASPLLLSLLASGFPEAKRAFAQSLFHWLALFLPCGGLSVMWRAALIAEEEFAVSSAATGMTPLLSVAALLLAPPGAGIWILVAATLGGVVLELAVLALAMRRKHFPLLPRWSGWDATIQDVLAQYVPLIAAAALAGGNLLVDQAMAATLASGSVSALNYGTKLTTVINAVAGGALATAVLPAFSRMAAQRQWPGIRALFLWQARLLLGLSIPVCALLITFSGTLVPLLFQRNTFAAPAVELIAAVQRFSLLQIPLALLLAIALRLIAALNANRILLRVALINAALGIAGNLLLMRAFGVPGIALANAVAMLVSFIIVISEVNRRIRQNRMLDSNAANSGNEG